MRVAAGCAAGCAAARLDLSLDGPAPLAASFTTSLHAHPATPPFPFFFPSGKNLVSIENRTAVRSCNFSYDGQQILFTTDNTMGQKSSVRVYSLQQLQQEGAGATPTLDFQTEGKAMASLWGICDETIVTGHHDGAINIWDLQVRAAAAELESRRGREGERTDEGGAEPRILASQRTALATIHASASATAAPPLLTRPSPSCAPPTSTPTKSWTCN